MTECQGGEGFYKLHIMHPAQHYIAFCESIKSHDPILHEAAMDMFAAVLENEIEVAMKVDAALNPLGMPIDANDGSLDMPSDYVGDIELPPEGSQEASAPETPEEVPSIEDILDNEPPLDFGELGEVDETI